MGKDEKMTNKEYVDQVSQPGDAPRRRYPLIPLKDAVAFPHTMVPLYVGRTKSLRALDALSREENKDVVLVAQRVNTEEEPGPEGIYGVGTRATVIQTLKMPDGTAKILVEAHNRERLMTVESEIDYLSADTTMINEMNNVTDLEAEAIKRNLLGLFERIVNLSRNLPGEAYVAAMNIEEPGRLSDVIASHLSLPVDEQQKLLEDEDLKSRMLRLSLLMERELQILELEQKIQGDVREEIDKSQRDMYLREQMKAIQKELTAGNESETDEFNEMRRKLEEAGLPPEAAEKLEREISRLEKMPAVFPEAPMIRNYIDWVLSLPWQQMSDEGVDMLEAERIMEDSHAGLKKIKERVLEYIAVYRLTGSLHGPILCFVGPPGTGKTSIGRSIAEAMGRKFVRISLGGMHDEAEIRGHRRTYLGSMPGRIIQAIRQAGTANPVFMMDEIDKVGADFRGDPSSALLEVLDPEQNNSFSDNYLEVPFDLSKVLFLTTANTLDTIPPALRDRMEVISFGAYIDEEKMAIARRFLVPRQIKENGIDGLGVSFSDGALLKIIDEYTRESGVRNLEREIGGICRKIARNEAAGRPVNRRVTAANVSSLLGKPNYLASAPDGRNQIGVATGLAWTEAGGETLSVEVSITPGKGNIQITGQLGDVMRESAQAALTYVRSRAEDLSLEPQFADDADIHIHVPAGAVPKDGPSAGVTMAVAIASAASRIPVRGDLAMTGELTLRGRILPVAGVKEKVLAAYRDRLKTVILPHENTVDLDEIPGRIRRDMSFIPVRHMDEVLENALVRKGRGRARSGKKSLKDDVRK